MVGPATTGRVAAWLVDVTLCENAKVSLSTPSIIVYNRELVNQIKSIIENFLEKLCLIL